MTTARRPRQRTKTIGPFRLTRHLHKRGAGWTVHTSGARRAWFSNSHDLERWLAGTLPPAVAGPLIESMGDLDR